MLKYLTLAAFAALSISLAMGTGGKSEPIVTKAQVPGTWMLNGSVKTIRFIFNKDGTFDYSGQNATSKGRWALDGAKLKFTWTHIDGSKVKPNTVVGRFPLTNGTFRVGKFVYAKPGTSIAVAQR
jgi:polyisoprenoid-binding protein YceI